MPSWTDACFGLLASANQPLGQPASHLRHWNCFILLTFLNCRQMPSVAPNGAMAPNGQRQMAPWRLIAPNERPGAILAPGLSFGAIRRHGAIWRWPFGAMAPFGATVTIWRQSGIASKIKPIQGRKLLAGA